MEQSDPVPPPPLAATAPAPSLGATVAPVPVIIVGQAERHVPVRYILSVIGLVAGSLLGIAVVWELRRIITLLIIAVFFAIVLNPAVDMAQRIGMRRGVATSIVFLLALGALSGLVYFFTRPLYDAGIRFAHDLPGEVKRAQAGKGHIGHLVRKYHLEHWAQQNSDKLRSGLAHAGGPALSTVRKLLTGLAGLATLLVVSFLVLLEAPRLTEAFLNALPPERARRVRRVAADAARSVTGYVLGNLATSFIAGLVVYITLRVLHVPFASVFGVWVAFVDLLPLVGGLLAGLPTVIVAALHSIPAGITTLIVFLVYQQIENHALNPLIMSRTVRLNPLWVMLSVLIGAELSGIVGALLAIPAAGTIQVVARDIWDERHGRLRETPTVGADEHPAE